MKEQIRRFLNLFPGEGKQAFLFSVLAFLLSCATSAAWKFSDALFLIHLSAEDLPVAYASAASLLIVFAICIISALNRYTPTQIFRTFLFCGIIYFSLVVAALLFDIQKSTQLFWYVIKIFGQMFFFQGFSCYWTFLDQYYHFQDSKRIYTLFNCSIYTGTACTGLFIQAHLLDIISFFATVLVLFVGTFFLTYTIQKKFRAVPDDFEIEGGQKEGKPTIKQFVQGIFRSKFTLFLMLGNLTLFLLMTTTEYSYFSRFEQHFEVPGAHVADDASNELTMFLGRLIACVGLGNFIVGYFLYSRWVISWGVTTLILFTPIGYLLTYLGWRFDPTLFFPIMGFVIVEGLYPVIEDNNFNLLLNAVPSKLKYQVRVLIESFSEPIGMLLSSILLSLEWINNISLGLILSIFSVTIAYIIGSQYYNAIFINLSQHALHLYKNTKEWFKAMTKKERKVSQELLLNYAASQDVDMQIIAVEGVVESHNEDLLKKLFHQKSLLPKAIVRLLEFLEESPFHSAPFVIHGLSTIHDETADSQVLAAIDYYIAKRGLLHPEKALLYIDSPHLLQRGAAIIAQRHAHRGQQAREVTASRTFAYENIEHLLSSPNEHELCLGVTLLGVEGLPNNIELLIDFLHHRSVEVAKSAANALQECLDTSSLRYAEAIMDELAERTDVSLRLACLKALAQISHTALIRPLIAIAAKLLPQEVRLVEKYVQTFGLKSVPALVSILQDSRMPDRSRILASKILSQVSLPQLNANLYSVIRTELERAYFYFYYGHSLPDVYEGHDISLLKEGLLSNFQSALTFIFQLLGNSRWIGDSELLIFSLNSKNEKIHSQAIETLETCADRKVFLLMRPLISDLPMKDKLHFCHRFVDTTYGIIEVLEKLAVSHSTLDIILAATWKYHVKLPGWRPFLRNQMVNQEEIFHHFAYELLET